jgi:hypothetical protein
MPVPPEQIADEGGVTVTFNVPATVTTTVVLPEHAPVMPVTEYVIVTVGVAITDAPVVALKAVEGVHV